MSELHYKYMLDADDYDRALPLMGVFQSFMASPVDPASTPDGTSFVDCLEKWHRRCIAPFATWPNARAMVSRDIDVVVGIMRQSGARFKRVQLKNSPVFKCLEPDQQRRLLGLAV